MNLEPVRKALHSEMDALIAYLLAKVKVEDWHAVQDAASDLRDIHAKLEIIYQLENEKTFG